MTKGEEIEFTSSGSHPPPLSGAEVDLAAQAASASLETGGFPRALGAQWGNRLRSVRVPIAYLVFGLLWIVVSDRVVASIATDPVALTTMQTYKGWAFIFLSTSLVFFLTQVERKVRQRARRRAQQGARDLARLAHERTRVAQDLHRTEVRLRALTRAQHAAQEAERRRVALELHDQVGQLATALRMTLERARDGRDAAVDHAPWYEDAIALSQEIGESVRAVAMDLRPPGLDHVGLPAALQEACRRWLSTSNVDLSYSSNVEDPRTIHPDVAIAFFRVAQEALTNVVRHANARNVSVTLSEHEGELTLVIVDDGQGFDMSLWDDVTRTTGLTGMAERMDALDGVLSVSAGTDGTCVRARAARTIQGKE